MSRTPDPDSGTCWSDLVDETRTSGLAEASPILDEETTPEAVLSSLNALTLTDDNREAYTRVHQPAPRLNKSHGFMRFIIRNQVSRKDYEEEQAALKSKQRKEDESASKECPIRQRKEVRVRPGFESYKPPHMRKTQE